MTKDERAKALIETEIRKGWPEIVQSVSVTPRIDFLDEPALDVLVGLTSTQQIPASIVRGKMLALLDDALKESGDERSTHIAFSAPDEDLDSEVDEAEEPTGIER